MRYLERFQLRTSYPDVVARVSEVCNGLKRQFPFFSGELVLDVGGVGRPVFDLFQLVELFRRVVPAGEGVWRLVPVTTHSGRNVGGNLESGLTVPKRDMLASFVVLFETRNLRLAAGLPDCELLVHELVNFKAWLSSAGRDSYGNDGKVAKNDDLVRALAAFRAWIPPRKQLNGTRPLL
jgi:hypothetical protein